MRKVIDSNQLQSEQLRLYLSASLTNFAVLTDYAAMEAYKGNTLVSIFKSMEVLCDFPDQVIVLKGTRLVSGLRGRAAGLQRRLVDVSSTREFPTYVRALLSAKSGDARYVKPILAHGVEASAHLEAVLRDAGEISEAIEKISSLFSKQEREAFRNGGDFSAGMVDRVVKHVMQVAIYLFRNHPSSIRWPQYGELVNTFIFRYSLCMYLLALDWGARGGIRNASAATLRNDMVDMNFAAYATYFDGLLTADKKTSRLHMEARIWLTALFACDLPSGLAGQGILG